MKSPHKKGMMEDFFDFMYTVMIAFFLLFFIGIFFTSGINQSQARSIEKVGDFNRLDSAVNNLRIQMYSGIDLESVDFNSLIMNSKVLGGRIITSCNDYQTKEDCLSDSIDVTPGVCDWFGSNCGIIPASPEG